MPGKDRLDFGWEQPALDDGETQRIGRILRILCIAMMAAMALAGLHNWLSGDYSAVAALALEIVFLAGGLALTSRGRLGWAVRLVTVSILVCATALLLLSREGFHDVVLLVFPAVLVLAGLVLRRSSYIAFTALVISVVAAAGVAEIHGGPSAVTYGQINYGDLIDVLLVLLMTALGVFLLSDGLKASLATTRRNAQALEESNAELSRQTALLGESEAKFRSMIDLAADGIVISDAAGRITVANQRACELAGCSKDEVVGQPLDSIFTDSSPEQGLRQSQLRRKDGAEIPIEINSTAMPDGTRQCSFRDVSELRRVQEQLHHAQRLESVGRLAGGIAHDFNNALTVISGYCEALLADPETVEAARSSIDEIRKAGERAATLTRQLLAFSRKQVLQPRPLNLSAVIGESEEMFRRLLGRNIELITHLCPDPGLVMADPVQVHQVVMNLVVNARDAMPDGGAMTIETRNATLDSATAADDWCSASPGPYVLLSVRDTGTGMDPEVLEHIFEPFFTTKPPGEGTGLGLSTVYGIVRQSRGCVRVHSEPAKGTAFEIYLPRIEAPAA